MPVFCRPWAAASHALPAGWPPHPHAPLFPFLGAPQRQQEHAAFDTQPNEPAAAPAGTVVWRLGDDGDEDEGDEGEEEVEIELDEYWAERFAVTAARRTARKQLEKAAEKAEKKAGVAERKRSAAAVALQASAPPAEPKACAGLSTGRDATEAAGSSTGEAAPPPATQTFVSEYTDVLSNLRMHE